MTTQTIEKIALTVENDLWEAQQILDEGENTTARINAHDAYNERVENDFVGTYKIKVERREDYDRFIEMLDAKKCRYTKIGKYRRDWHNDIITHEEFMEFQATLERCTCSKCDFRLPLFEEWKTGKIVEKVYIDNAHYQGWKTKEIKMNKALQNAGFEQEVLDFYSAQIKTEQWVYVTISDRAQHIAGMSAYAERRSWNGFGGTSCQDPRHDEDMAMALAGALHDNKLLVCMMHDNLEDLEDMQDKLKARTLMRITHFLDEQFCIGNQTYGNNETKSALRTALKQLAEYRIYGEEVHSYQGDNDELVRHKEEANGACHVIHTGYEEVYVNETIEEEVDCECPMCKGTGKHEVYVYKISDHMKIDCPMCNGGGTYTAYIYEEIEKYEEVEFEEDLGFEVPYDGEGFDHYRTHTVQYLNETMLKADAIRFGRKLV